MSFTFKSLVLFINIVTKLLFLRPFGNKTFRKHRRLISLMGILSSGFTCIESLAIFHPHFPSAFDHPQFSIRI